MRITRRQLRRIIKEEKRRLLEARMTDSIDDIMNKAGYAVADIFEWALSLGFSPEDIAEAISMGVSKAIDEYTDVPP